MTKTIKAFITRDDFVTPSSHTTAPVFELSEQSMTYARRKDVMFPSEYQKYALYSFSPGVTNQVTNSEANLILRTVTEFVSHLTTESYTAKQQIISTFVSRHNSLFPTTPVLGFDYNNSIIHANTTVPDYVTFTISDINCSIWLSENTFNRLYPFYDINVVLPFENFDSIIRNTLSTITALDAFDLTVFNDRIEEDKAGYPTTRSRVLNIPYRVPGSSTLKNCYFGFNIYGIQGNHDHILRLELHRYLTEELGLATEYVEERFPSLLNINEFFIIPRWDNLAIDSQVGQGSIASQMVNAFSAEMDIAKFIKLYDDEYFLTKNTYNVPNTYNNLLLHVVNGYYSQDQVKDFKQYYPDMITVNTMHPDFDRMSQRTQRFMVLLENLLGICDSKNETELFNKIIANTDYDTNIVTRGGVTYITTRFEEHQYYVIPRYEFLNRVE